MLEMTDRVDPQSKRAPNLTFHKVKLGLREILLNGYDVARRRPPGTSGLNVVSYLKKSLK